MKSLSCAKVSRIREWGYSESASVGFETVRSRRGTPAERLACSKRVSEFEGDSQSRRREYLYNPLLCHAFQEFGK